MDALLEFVAVAILPAVVMAAEALVVVIVVVEGISFLVEIFS